MTRILSFLQRQAPDLTCLPGRLPDPGAVDALLCARHGAPFDLLGLRGQTLRGFDPGAERMWCLSPEAEVAEMTPLGGGLFQLDHVPGSVALTRRYRLAGAAAGTVWDWDDPYRFGPVLGPLDEHLISEGRHLRLWERLGAHPVVHEGVAGTAFAVWAPNARRVSVIGAFNHWRPAQNPMRARGATGIWELFLPGVGEGALYKFDILGQGGETLPQKADPLGFAAEPAPATASVVTRLPAPATGPRMAQRTADPVSIYEVHAASWQREAEGGILSWAELAQRLIPHAAGMGFTHLELLPVSEHPFGGSWGYQPLGLYAPTCRHGSAKDFADFVAAAHEAGLGVILDWVPGHFPADPHGLGWFDGTALYHHADPREGRHRDWDTLIYNYGRREVRNYLIANALYWLKVYGVDGLRVDAVASMLYRDYSRPDGEWVPNVHGGRENLEAIAFLQEMNREVYAACPDAMTMAEESTSFPGVSHPVHEGGLGFGFKWNMGWMNDSLAYFREDPIHRRHHHGRLTFGPVYAFSENFVLPISHDEVVHGKGSMLAKMPGTGWEQFANLRAFYAYMWGYPGKKLLFMGCEFAQGAEWNHDRGLDWHQAGLPQHDGIRRLIGDLNRTYRATPALYRDDLGGDGFRWLVADDDSQSVLGFLRRDGTAGGEVAVICNFTPVERTGYRIGLPEAGPWREILNTDAQDYGGGGRGNLGRVMATGQGWNGWPASAELTLPPLSVIWLRQEEAA